MGTRSPLTSTFVMEAFYLQARNIHLFLPIYLIAVAYNTISVLGYSYALEPLVTEVSNLAEDLVGASPAWRGYADEVVQLRIHAGHLVAVGSAYLLVTAFTLGPTILAVTVSTAVTACSGSGERRSSLRALVRELLAGGGRGMKGLLGTALLGHILHAVACKGAIFVFAFYMDIFRRYTSPVLFSGQLVLFLLAHLFALYVEIVCTLAVVVSAAEPAGSFHGVRALRQAWWIMAEKTTPAVILLFVKGMATAITGTIISIWFYWIHYYLIHYNHAMSGYTIFPKFVDISLYAALQLWFVCATTLYYYQCRRQAVQRSWF